MPDRNKNHGLDTAHKAIDPELASFFQEAANLEPLEYPRDYPEHMRIRDAMEREAMYGKASSHIPARVQARDGILTLPGRELAYRLYRPIAVTSPSPAILYAHGGGWVAGSIYTHDSLCAEISLRTARTVISIQYRRAPENPFPAAHADLWDAWNWVHAYGRTLGVDTRAIALSGDSAGGHLALGCVLRHRLEGAGIPAPDKLLLWYPNTDRRPDTMSRKEYSQGYGLTASRMDYFWECHEGAASHDSSNYLLYPGHVPVPEGLPPTVIVTAEHDLLRDEAEHYAERMRAANKHVTLVRAERMLHGFARLHEESKAANLWVRRGCMAFMRSGTAGIGAPPAA